MPLRFKCLVMDHDDTVVDSTASIHYPSFVEFMNLHHPEIHYSLDDYFRLNFEPGILELFRDVIGMSREEMLEEQEFWNDYVQRHVPSAYDGIREILEEQRKRGGLICVISHSLASNILRDYKENGLPAPDLVFGWEIPAEKRKPSPWGLDEIKRRFSLESSDILVVDDLKPGYDMAKARDIRFAAAGWSNSLPEIESFMRSHCDFYCKTTSELRAVLFPSVNT